MTPPVRPSVSDGLLDTSETKKHHAITAQVLNAGYFGLPHFVAVTASSQYYPSTRYHVQAPWNAILARNRAIVKV